LDMLRQDVSVQPEPGTFEAADVTVFMASVPGLLPRAVAGSAGRVGSEPMSVEQLVG
jgi:hypothetical protein